MKVSTRVEYGLIALTDIAMYSENGKTITASDIALREHISLKYLEQILMSLKQAGFVRSQKGVGGGYMLSRSAGSIVISDILNALDTSILADTCSSDTISEEGLRPLVNSCFWVKMNEYLRSFTSNLTLSELISRCSGKANEKWDMYMI